MRKGRIFIFIFTLLLLTRGYAQNCAHHRYLDTIASDVLIYSDIPFATADPYGIIGSQELKLDLYEAFGDTLAKRPLILFSFGGAFLIGDKSQPFIPDFCKYFAKRGYAVAAINYRIGFNTLDQGSAERAAYRAVQDVRAALRFFAEFSQAFRIDTNNIFLAGTSAGCVASLHSVFMTEQDRPASTYGTLLEPQDLGCANCSGNNLYGNNDVPVKGIINCWGAMLDTLYISNSAQDSVPVISFHGTNDLIVPYVYGNPFQLPIFPPMYGSYTIHQRLNNMGIFNDLKPLNGAGHEPELLNWTYADTIFAMSRDFLYEIIQPKTSVITGEQSVCTNTVHTYSIPLRTGNTYCWNITGGNILSQNENTIEVQWITAGVQQVLVREINTLLASSDTMRLAVEVIRTPIAGYFITQYEKSIACQNQSLHSTTQTWHFGDGATSTDTNPLHVYTAPGTYPVMLVAQSGTCTDTATVLVTLEFCPVADFDYTIDNLTASFTDLSAYATSVSWNFGDGNTSSQRNPAHTFAEAGIYTVLLFTVNSVGCTDTVSRTIELLSTSAQPIGEEYTLQVFPNPAYDMLFVKFQSEIQDNVILEIFNTTGERILQDECANNVSKRISLRELPSGLYNLRFSQQNFSVCRKVIKM